jgi:phosphopantetheinyl transferase
VRKEACLKAAGIGLAGRLDELDAGWRSDDTPKQLSLAYGARRWDTVVVSLPMPPEVVAAAAVVAYCG